MCSMLHTMLYVYTDIKNNLTCNNQPISESDERKYRKSTKKFWYTTEQQEVKPHFGGSEGFCKYLVVHEKLNKQII